VAEGRGCQGEHQDLHQVRKSGRRVGGRDPAPEATMIRIAICAGLV
jgi:hypothetical protein